MIYTITKSETGHEVSAFLKGQAYVADSNHPNFSAIRSLLLETEEVDSAEVEEIADELVSLFNIAFAAGQKFEHLTDRVTYSTNRIYFDGEEMHGALVDAIITAIADGTTDFQPLARFLEKVTDNPNQHSKDNLYRWLANRDFGIADDGDILGWKGVNYHDGLYLSTTSGDAFADGVFYKSSKIPHVPGTLVEMVRNDVHWDPAVGCAAGLHVGVYSFASDYGDCMLQVKINPRDVVSVPTEASDQKMRVCRYFIVAEISDHKGTVVVREKPILGEPDPELERLLAEEEEIERRVAETQQDAEATATDDQISCAECGTMFKPKGAKNIYCKKQCRWAGDRKAKKAEAKAVVKAGRKK